MPEVGDVIELTVDRVAHGGFCVGRHEGQAVFVRHSLPGERVRARVTEHRPRYLRADAVDVLAASPHRVTPPCPYAGPGRCGGCDWQHVDVGHQRVLKAAVVAEALARLAGIDREVTVEPVPGSPDGLGWRTRVRWAVRRDGVVGLHRHRSHDVQPVDCCRIAHPLVTAAGVERRPWPHVRAVEVTAAPATGQRSVVVTPVGHRQPMPPVPLEAPATVLRDDGRGRTTTVSGSGHVEERAAGRRWRVTGSGFWQVHPDAADTLAAAVRELAGPVPGERVLDLYAGVGLFAGALAADVGPDGAVVAVEGDRGAAADARHNLADLPWVRVRRERVGAGGVAGWAAVAGGRVDVVVLDPPRVGAGPELCRALAAAGPRVVVYVACDPAALARDVAAFGAAGYRLAELRAYDLFPMTGHVECVAALRP